MNKISLWTRGDLDGFFGFFTNSLTNVLTATFLISVVLGFTNKVVFGAIVPAMVISLAFGNIYYAYAAYKLNRKEERNTATAVPYGLSVPHYFIVVFAIMLPVYTKTGDLELAWGIGVAWCFVHGIVVMLCSLIGPTLRKYTPRSAMLGTLAGVAITFIAMNPAAQAFEMAWLGIICFGIIMFGWFAHVKMPFNIPAGLMAIIVGTILGWATGYMKVEPLVESAKTIGFNMPLPQLNILFIGLQNVGPYLISAIPLGVYLFMETLLNVESAEVSGDKYKEKEISIVAALGTMIGAIFGSPVPTLVYIGHSGWKSVGGKVGYSWMTGVVLLLLGMIGLLNILLKIIPIVAILPILVYIGMIVTSLAYEKTPKSHGPAITLAIIPWIANWAITLINSTLGAVKTDAATVGYDVLQSSGVFYKGLNILGSSPILVGLFLGAITAFIIDRKFKEASIYAFISAVSSFFGLIHAANFGFNQATFPAIGYAALGLMCMYFYLMRDKNEVKIEN